MRLNRAVLLVLAVLVALLLIVLPFMHANATAGLLQLPKRFPFLYIMAGVAPLVFGCMLWKSSPSLLSITTIDITLVGLLCYLLVNRYLLQDLYSFSFRFHELLGLVMFYIMLRQLNFRYYRWLLLALVGSGILQALYGSLQLYGVYPSHHVGFALTGSFFNPGPYAGFLTTVFPVALGIWLYRDTLFPEFNVGRITSNSDVKQSNDTPSIVRWFTESWNFFRQIDLQAELGPWLGLMGVVTTLLVLPPTRSRAGLLAAALTGAYLILHRYNLLRILSARLNSLLKKGLALILLVVIVGSGLTGLYWMKKDSAYGRLLIWSATTHIIQTNPITGMGFDRFKVAYMDAQADWLVNHPDSPYAGLADNTKYAFNDFLQFTAEQGLIGLALLVVLGILIIRVTSKTNTIWLTIAKAGVGAIAVFALFSYPAQILLIKMSLVLFLVVIASCGTSHTIQVSNFSYRKEFILKTILIACILWGTAKVITRLHGLQNATKQWKSAMNLYQSEQTKQAIAVYENAYPVFRRSGEFLTNYGKALSVAGTDSQAITILQQAKRHRNTLVVQTALGNSYKNLEQYKKAEQAYKQAHRMLPDRFYPLYLLVKLYEETGQREKLTPIAKKLIVKKPKIESMAVRQIKQEMEQILD